MKRLLALTLAIAGCGYSQRDNETIAYVKHVTNERPILCGDRTDAELDMRTPGTMTSERVRFTVLRDGDALTLRKANESGLKVKIISDERRLAWCGEPDVITRVEVLPKETP